MQKRRWCRRRRRLTGALVLLSPMLWIVGTDALRRGSHLATYDGLHIKAYAATVAACAVFWAALLYNTARPRGIMRQAAAGIFVTLFTLSVGVQMAFHGLYEIYLSHDAQIYAQSLPQSLLGYLPLSRPIVLLQIVLNLFVALCLVIAARTWVRPRKIARHLAYVLVPAVLIAITYVPASYRMWQSTTPDIIYFHGLVSQVRERFVVNIDAPDLRVQRRTPEAVPAMTPRPSPKRNVLFILQESLRGDICCNEYVPDVHATDPPKCATPFSNDAAPNRFAFNQMRANASTTAISISNLWSGVPSHLSMKTLLSVPLLWEYADAAGFNGQYWTCQNVMFGSMRLYVQDLPLTHRAYATHLSSHAGFDEGALDADLTDRVIADWASIEEPFFGVVHYSNVHFPYVYDEKHAPFQPSAFTKAASKNEHFLNYYRNVAYLSDLAVGRLIDHVRASDKGQRTVIVYTSDHGEAFREHWQLGHTSSLYDEEILVPGWIDAPAGTLTDNEQASLRGAKEEFVWHFDLPPTMLDLMGIWDDPEMRPFRARMIGNPLTRPERTTRPVPINNCTWLWECGFRNWGLMQGHMKIEAREWDNEFHCFDLLADPGEDVNLGEDACAPLPEIARAQLGPMPFQEYPRGRELLYGPVPTTTAQTGSAPPK
jgi:glucan phosphoethanolaminetransferase (alkaline phosphatase superfamily)